MKSWNSRSEDVLEKKRIEFIKSVPAINLVDNFPLYVTRQELARYLVRYELFKKTLLLKGSIVECGVYNGASLIFFAQLATIFEPYAFNREIIGFDTFSGFPSVHKKDGPYAIPKDLGDVCLSTIKKSIQLLDENRPVGHIPKVKLVKGDAQRTIPKYFKENPHVLVSLLYVDFDLYEPTKVALKTIVPRMPKGAILAFDELNEKRRQGETIALLESLNIHDHKIEKYSYEPHISYITI